MWREQSARIEEGRLDEWRDGKYTEAECDARGTKGIIGSKER